MGKDGHIILSNRLVCYTLYVNWVIFWMTYVFTCRERCHEETIAPPWWLAHDRH